MKMTSTGSSLTSPTGRQIYHLGLGIGRVFEQSRRVLQMMGFSRFPAQSPTFKLPQDAMEGEAIADVNCQRRSEKPIV
jgi:hypothetical protein